jgi:hypothetical protein
MKGMAELSTPSGWLLAKNTHRVFFDARPCHPGYIVFKSCSLIVLKSDRLASQI